MKKHFKKDICKPATTAITGTPLDHLLRSKPRAPALTSSFSPSPSSSGSSFTDTSGFAGWLHNASSLSLGVAQVCFLDLIPYISEY
jgi:hypothetical protein